MSGREQKGKKYNVRNDRKTYAFLGYKGTLWSNQLKLTEAHAQK